MTQATVRTNSAKRAVKIAFSSAEFKVTTPMMQNITSVRWAEGPSLEEVGAVLRATSTEAWFMLTRHAGDTWQHLTLRGTSK